MNSQNLASDQNTRARTRRKRHATSSPSDSLCVSSESCATRVLHLLSRLSPKLETTVILRCSIVEDNVCAIWLCVVFFCFCFFFFFWFVCLYFFFLSSPVDIATVSLFRLRAFRCRLFCPREALPLRTSPVNCLAVSSH